MFELLKRVDRYYHLSRSSKTSWERNYYNAFFQLYKGKLEEALVEELSGV